MSFKPDPANDPNDAYATDWWTVTAHAVPVWHFPADKRDLAERRSGLSS